MPFAQETTRRFFELTCGGLTTLLAKTLASLKSGLVSYFDKVAKL
jgi:hypothetical protein